MKTIYKVQNVIAAIAIIMAVHLANGIEISRSEAMSATIMVLLTIVMLLGRLLEKESKQKMLIESDKENEKHEY